MALRLDKSIDSYYGATMFNHRLNERVDQLKHQVDLAKSGCEISQRFVDDRIGQLQHEDEKLLGQIQGVDFAVRQLNDHLALLMKHLGLAFDGRVRVVKEPQAVKEGK